MVDRVLKKRYAIQQQLGKNAGRQTLLARDLQTEELVAIKVLSFGADFQWDDLKLFEREAETLQSLSHPAIPRYLDHFEFQTPKTKRFALVQSYIQAKSLEEWVKLGRSFNEEEIKQLAQALLEILMYLHGQHPPVIHRDIKPSNILLRDSSPLDKGGWGGQVYLVDFGSVQTLTATEGSTITVVGTYGYMPPEQFGGRAVPASDLYSLGATLIYLVTGTHPAELPQEDLRIQFESAVNLNPDLIDWLKWITEPSLNRRLASARKALKALEHPPQRTEISAVGQKLFGSRIQLKKDKETVEILIPPASLSSEIVRIRVMLDRRALIMVSMSLFCFIICLLNLFMMIQKFDIVTLGYFFGALLSFLPLGLALIYESGVPANFFRIIRVHLNQQQIFLTYKWLWWEHLKAPILKKAISKLVYSQGYCKTTINQKRGTRFILPKITILEWQKKHELYVDHLTASEIDWLVRELSEWSGVQISK